MTEEVSRAQEAVKQAEEGKKVAVISAEILVFMEWQDLSMKY